MDALVKDTFTEYRPTNWLPNGHLQTIYSTILDTSNIDRIDYNRHTLQLKDAGSISLDFNNPGKSKVLVICHGLTGGSHESYVRTVISQIADDTTSVVVNFRGCANTTVTSPLLYSGGQTNDLRSALLYIRNCYPDAELVGMGFSLGANVLTKYIGEEGDRCPFKAAISLANPWNLLKGSEQLESSYLGHYLYNRAMGKSLKTLMHIHEHAVKGTHADELAQLDAFNWPTIRDFDNTITRKLGGHPPHFPFPSAEAYYAWASSTGYLHNVKIPVLGLNAEDDPIVSKESWPEAGDESKSSPSNIYKCKVNPLVQIYHTKYGGHLAWFEGGSPLSTFIKGPSYKDNYPPPRRWFAKPIARVVERLFTEEFGEAPGGAIMPIRSTDENVEWETDDREHIKYVGYSLVTKDEIIHGGEESHHIVTQGL